MYVIKINEKHYRCPDRKTLERFQRTGKLPEKTRVYSVNLKKWDYAVNWLEAEREELDLQPEVSLPANSPFIERSQVLSRCDSCKKDFEIQYDFCIYCGKSIKNSHVNEYSDSLICKNCGLAHSSNYKMCIKCGATLKTTEI